MKKNRIHFSYHEAVIYRKYYRPSANPLLLFKSLLSLFFTGETPFGRSTPTEKQKQILK
ncbi:MAG TPA: hypothetical protein VIK74_09950 [Parasegetibacter sp.]